MLLAGDNGRLSCVAAHRLGGGGSFERADGDTEFHRALRLVRQGGEVRGDVMVRREALPLLGEVPSAHTGERGRRRGGLEQGGKERAEYRINLSLRDQCAHRSWQSASPMHCTKNTLPTRGGTDSHVASLLGMTVVFYTSLCLFPNGTFSALATLQSALRPPASRCGSVTARL